MMKDRTVASLITTAVVVTCSALLNIVVVVKKLKFYSFTPEHYSLKLTST